MSSLSPLPDTVVPAPPAPTPAGRWRARLLALVEVAACSGVPTQVLVQYAAVAVGVRAWQAPGVPTLTFLAVTQLADSLLLITLMRGIEHAHGDPVGPLWRGDRPLGREIRLGLLLVPADFLIVGTVLGLAGWLAPGLHNVADNPFESMLTSPARAG